jgi:chromosomal replication initiation ATPase DnaA
MFPIADARQASMYVLYCDLGLSSKETGALFSREHSTVLHSVFAVEAKWETDMTFRRRFDQLRSDLGLKPWLLKAGGVS